MNRATLLLTCPDRPGLVARLSGFIARHGGNIIHADHHIDSGSGQFLTRLEWDVERFDLAIPAIGTAFEPTAHEIGAEWELHFNTPAPRMAIFASHQDHCLLDLLWRHGAGDLPAQIVLIMSNHRHLEPVADQFGIEFCYFPVTPETRREAEAAQLEKFAEREVSVVVLAKYMQILSEAFISHYRRRIINIHHSFLPAFPGARPYHRAFERGVKIIGATAHYVTGDLDDGPIIEQDIVSVSHRDEVDDLIRKGRDLERVVLARAVRHHLENRVLVYGNKTAVFA
ncbi:MAG: formyltetrahydrofolate deformylase [Chloroflexi bacterium]|nr:formyltetrahydrofolate deformylase [Chloroflexota bacterium]